MRSITQDVCLLIGEVGLYLINNQIELVKEEINLSKANNESNNNLIMIMSLYKYEDKD